MIYRKKDNFWIYHIACIDEDPEINLNKKVWVPIGQNHEDKQGVLVEEGDIFKFGKKNFKINKICNLLRKEKEKPKPKPKPELVSQKNSPISLKTE